MRGGGKSKLGEGGQSTKAYGKNAPSPRISHNGGELFRIYHISSLGCMFFRFVLIFTSILKPCFLGSVVNMRYLPKKGAPTWHSSNSASQDESPTVVFYWHQIDLVPPSPETVSAHSIVEASHTCHGWVSVPAVTWLITLV